MGFHCKNRKKLLEKGSVVSVGKDALLYTGKKLGTCTVRNGRKGNACSERVYRVKLALLGHFIRWEYALIGNGRKWEVCAVRKC